MRALPVLTLAAAMLLAPSSVAFAAPSLGYKLMTSTVSGKKYVAQWYPCAAPPVLTYQVNAAAAGDVPAAMSDVSAALEQVSKATGFAFKFTGMTDYVPTSSSFPSAKPKGADIVISWVNSQGPNSSDLLGADKGSFADGTGGSSMAVWTAGGTTHAASTAGFVVMNAQSKVPAGFGDGVTRGQVLLHELGHVMGLAHIDDSRQLMYPLITAASSAHYSRGDLAGLKRLGPLGASCSSPKEKQRWLGIKQVLART